MPVETFGKGGAVITGAAIGGFRAAVVLSGIKLYLKTGIKANRQYTPANMRKVASEYTGKQYARSRKGLVQAAQDLEQMMAGKSLDAIGKAERQPLHPPITLSNGTVVTHTYQPNGSQLATPDRPSGEMTNEEWDEYVIKLRARA